MNLAVIPTNAITVDQAIEKGTWKWNKDENDCDFKGYVPGYVCGWCVEIKKDDKVDYCSTTFTNDYEEIRNPWFVEDWNELGISADVCDGWEPTGIIVFRGYFTEHYDWEEREEYYNDASEEVLGLFDKYCVAD